MSLRARTEILNQQRNVTSVTIHGSNGGNAPERGRASPLGRQ